MVPSLNLICLSPLSHSFLLTHTNIKASAFLKHFLRVPSHDGTLASLTKHSPPVLSGTSCHEVTAVPCYGLSPRQATCTLTPVTGSKGLFSLASHPYPNPTPTVLFLGHLGQNTLWVLPGPPPSLNVLWAGFCAQLSSCFFCSRSLGNLYFISMLSTS